MKKVLLLSVAVVIVTLAVVFTGFAGGDIPDGVEVFQVGDHTCVVVANSLGWTEIECFCPCEEECNVQDSVGPTRVPPDGPASTPTTVPTNPPDPTPTDPPPPPPPPEPTDKPKCNSGRGNGSEGDPDCDPGNSGGHNQGGD